MPTIGLLPYAVISTSLAAWVTLLAFQQRSNFFSAAVYLSKSNACMLILWNFGIFLAVVAGKIFQKVFFGPLRLIELERLHERIWYAVTESLLALTIFRDEFDTIFVVRFVGLLFIKVFHWLAADRVESMEQSPHISRLFHFRMCTVLSSLWLADLFMTALALESILLEGPTVMILFASEYFILSASNWNTTARYVINTIDLQSDVPWEGKSILLFYVDLVTDLVKLLVYLVFFTLILTFYGLPINVLRDVYITARSFIRKVRDLRRYRLATQNMEDRYPSATATEMAALSDKTCIICREEMNLQDQSPEAVAARQRAVQPTGRGFFKFLQPERKPPNDTPKKLPCAHIFHFHCLKSWLERQQSCPTCRRSVLRTEVQQPQAPPAAANGANVIGQLNRPTATPAPEIVVTEPGAPLPAVATTNGSAPRAETIRDNPFLRFQLPSRRASDSFPSASASGRSSSPVLDSASLLRTVLVAPEIGVPKNLHVGPKASEGTGTAAEATSKSLPIISVKSSSTSFVDLHSSHPTLIPLSNIAGGPAVPDSTVSDGLDRRKLHEQLESLEAALKLISRSIDDIRKVVQTKEVNGVESTSENSANADVSID